MLRSIDPLCTIKFKERASPDGTPRVTIDFDDRCPPEVLAALVATLTATLGPRWAVVPEFVMAGSR